MTTLLSKCGIDTLMDLLFQLPYRYQDRTRITPIADLRQNDFTVIAGKIIKIEVKKGHRSILVCDVADKTGLLKLRFFHFNSNLIQSFKDKPYIRAFGEIRFFSHHLEMIHPEYQLFSEEGIYPVEEHLTPIYPSTQGLSQNKRRQLIKQALALSQHQQEPAEWLSEDVLKHLNLMPISSALTLLHAPPPDISVQSLEQCEHPALRRLVFEELLAHQLSMKFAKQRLKRFKAPSCPTDSKIKQSLIHRLPYTLTSAQQRVLQEIEHDLGQEEPMLRLVQGDVGAGKTIVAILAAVQAIEAGYQVAFMAPTEILSEQHYLQVEKLLLPLNIEVKRLQGKMPTKAKREALAALKTGRCQIVVGTHALFQEEVEFHQLGLVIIDEQHRFGVEQRLLLQQKGQDEKNLTMPHQLFMTATPIPRTLAMAYFSHLDLSIIDELPPGRTPITTAVIPTSRRLEIIEKLKLAILEKRQAYWVCTLIEESESLQCACATETAEILHSELPNARIGLIHGRMRPQEKESAMQAFKQGTLDLLVATTVIEVGVDVPNASLMIIENAERLGLSQLHQLRGRVGRGAQQSFCLLLYQAPLSLIGKERLKMIKESTDGFLIAEKDMQLRGSGEILGKKQTGYHQFRLAKLERDELLLQEAKTFSQTLIQTQSTLAQKICQRWLGHFEQFLQG